MFSYKLFINMIIIYNMTNHYNEYGHHLIHDKSCFKVDTLIVIIYYKTNHYSKRGYY